MFEFNKMVHANGIFRADGHTAPTVHTHGQDFNHATFLVHNFQTTGGARLYTELTPLAQIVIDLKNYSSVSPLTEKETRCLGILSAKCPVFMGLLRTAYAKLFLYDPFTAQLGWG